MQVDKNTDTVLAWFHMNNLSTLLTF